MLPLARSQQRRGVSHGGIDPLNTPLTSQEEGSQAKMRAWPGGGIALAPRHR